MDDLPWIAVARGELGQHELPGDADNPRIVEYHSATSLRATDDETPWCSAFVNWVMQHCGYTGTQSAAARSWLNWGDRLPLPRYGCVTVLHRGQTWQGHVGFFVGYETGRESTHVRLLGGNQGNAVSVATFAAAAVLGYRWPKDLAGM